VIIDLFERYDDGCSDLGWQLSDEEAQSVGDAMCRILLVIYARDHGIGVTACDAKLLALRRKARQLRTLPVGRGAGWRWADPQHS
jgi:hypothetical protein